MARLSPLAVLTWELAIVLLGALPQESVLLGERSDEFESSGDALGLHGMELAEEQLNLRFPQPDCKSPRACRIACRDIYPCQTWVFYFHGEDAHCWLFRDPENITCDENICTTGVMVKPSTTRTSSTTFATVVPLETVSTTTSTTYSYNIAKAAWAFTTSKRPKAGYNYEYYGSGGAKGRLNAQTEAAVKAGQEQDIKAGESSAQAGNQSALQAELLSKEQALALEEKAEEIMKGNGTQAEKDAAQAVAAEAAAEAALKKAELADPEAAEEMRKLYESLLAVKNAWQTLLEKEAKGLSSEILEEARQKVAEAEGNEAEAKATAEIRANATRKSCSGSYCYEYYSSKAAGTEDMDALRAEELMQQALANGDTLLAAKYEDVMKSAETAAGLHLAAAGQGDEGKRLGLSLTASEHAAELAQKMVEVARARGDEASAAEAQAAEERYKAAQSATEEAIKSGDPEAIQKAHSAEAEAEDAAKHMLAAAAAQAYLDDPSRLDALDTHKLLTELESKSNETGLANEDLIFEQQKLAALLGAGITWQWDEDTLQHPYYHYYYGESLAKKDVTNSEESIAEARKQENDEGIYKGEEVLKSSDAALASMAKLSDLRHEEVTMKHRAATDASEDVQSSAATLDERYRKSKVVAAEKEESRAKLEAVRTQQLADDAANASLPQAANATPVDVERLVKEAALAANTSTQMQSWTEAVKVALQGGKDEQKMAHEAGQKATAAHAEQERFRKRDEESIKREEAEAAEKFEVHKHGSFYHSYYTYVDAVQLADQDVNFTREVLSEAEQNELSDAETLQRQLEASKAAAEALHQLVDEKEAEISGDVTTEMKVDAEAVDAARTGVARAAADEAAARAQRSLIGGSNESEAFTPEQRAAARHATLDARLAGEQLAAMSSWEAAAEAASSARKVATNATTEAPEVVEVEEPSAVEVTGAATNATEQLIEVDAKRQEMFEAAVKAHAQTVKRKERAAMVVYQQRIVELAESASAAAAAVSADPSVEGHEKAAEAMAAYANEKNSMLQLLVSRSPQAQEEEAAVKVQLGGIAKLQESIKSAAQSQELEEALAKIFEGSIEATEAHAKHTAGRGAEEALRSGVLPSSRLTRAEVLRRLSTRFDVALHALKDSRVLAEEANANGQDPTDENVKMRRKAVEAASAGSSLFAVRVKMVGKHIEAKRRILLAAKKAAGHAASDDIVEKERDLVRVQALSRLSIEVYVLMQVWYIAAQGALADQGSLEKGQEEEAAANGAERAYADFLATKHIMERHHHALWNETAGENATFPFSGARAGGCVGKVHGLLHAMGAASLDRQAKTDEAQQARRNASSLRDLAREAGVTSLVDPSNETADLAKQAKLRWHRAEMLAKQAVLAADKSMLEEAQLYVASRVARANCSALPEMQKAPWGDRHRELAKAALEALQIVVQEATSSADMIDTAVTAEADGGEGSGTETLAVAQLLGDTAGRVKVRTAHALAVFEARRAELLAFDFEQRVQEHPNSTTDRLERAREQLAAAKATENELSVALANIMSPPYPATKLSINQPHTYCAAYCALNMGQSLPQAWTGACCKQAMDEFGDLISCSALSPKFTACKCAQDDSRPFLDAQQDSAKYPNIATSGYVCAEISETYLKYEGLSCPDAEVGAWSDMDVDSCQEHCDSSSQCQAIEVNGTSCRASSSCNEATGVASPGSTIYVKQVP